MCKCLCSSPPIFDIAADSFPQNNTQGFITNLKKVAPLKKLSSNDEVATTAFWLSPDNPVSSHGLEDTKDKSKLPFKLVDNWSLHVENSTTHFEFLLWIIIGKYKIGFNAVFGFIGKIECI